ncbi:MAG: CBS domain-containing protein [Armatimonadota bacterium]
MELTARDVMTRDVVTIPETASLRDAVHVLVNHEISGAPVVDESGNVVGMLSEADILDERKREAALPRVALFGVSIIPDDSLRRAYEEGMSLQVKDVMTKKVISVEEDTSVKEIARLMVRHRINRVPVIKDRRLVGIVARDDILRAL